MRPSIHFETHCSTHRSQPTFQNYSLDLCAMFFWRTVKNPCFHIAIFWGRLSSYGVPRVSSVPGPVCRWELPTDNQNYEKGRAERMKGALLVCFFFLLFFRHAVGIHTMRKRAYYIYHYISLYFIIYHYISLYIIIYHYISLYIIIYHYISLYIIIYHYISLYIIIYHYISHMLCHVMSCHVMSCDVKSCDVM